MWASQYDQPTGGLAREQLPGHDRRGECPTVAGGGLAAGPVCQPTETSDTGLPSICEGRTRATSPMGSGSTSIIAGG